MIIIFHSLYFLVKYYIKLIKKRRCLQEFTALQAVHEKVNLQNCKPIDAEENLSFDPPVYKQRYEAVQQIFLDNIWKKDIKKIVDFGCAEYGLFKFIKRLCRIEHILEVDVDEELLKENLYKIHPLTVDYLSRRTEPLTVQVLIGSISDPDHRLLGVDVVVGIEIIEHLFPDTLDALPYNIFGFIKPKIAIFTTPNADFNVLFPNFKRFRHDDHKFEWSREQFELWATNISSRFPEYSVSFRGIGKGPRGTEHLGCCSQMAVFVREHKSEDIESNIHVEGSIGVMNGSCTCKNCVPEASFGVCTYFSCTQIIYDILNDSGNHVRDVGNYYKLVEIVNYPYEVDERSPEEKILDELKYRMCLLGNINGRFFSDEYNRLEIPLIELVFNQHTYFTTICEAREILEKAGYKIEECMICGELETCVVYEPEMESCSSTPTSRSNDDSNTDTENWSTVTTEGEPSEWEVNSDLQRGSWTYNSASQEIQQAEDLEDVREIIDNLINNLELVATAEGHNVLEFPQKFYAKEENISHEEEGRKCNNLESEPNNVMYDSGYYKSNTNLTTSTQSGSDLLDGELLDDQLINCTNVEEIDKVDKVPVSPNLNVSSEGYIIIDSEKIPIDLKAVTQECKTAVIDVGRENILQGFTKTYEIGNCQTSSIRAVNNTNVDKVSFVAKSTGRVANPEISLESKLTVTPNVSTHKGHHLKDICRESVPGTSSVKKKKIKRFETDDEGGVQKNEDIEKKVEIDEEEERKDEIIVPEVVEVAHVPEPVVENGDLANNNRDVEGNNYPNAQQNNERNIEENDNENAVLQNNVVNGEAERNEDLENRNAEIEEEEVNNDVEIASANAEDGHEVNELEIEVASREALFDPNSEVDLLEEFNDRGAAVAAAAAAAAPNIIEVVEPFQNIVAIGVNVNSNDGSQVDPVLPISADPFPNWLLHLLGADIVEEREPHDEPHFYCQGDGIGVHPSFIEEDFEEDHSSSGSDTTSSGSTNDDAEAEPTVSEVEVVSLPDDANDVGSEQNAVTVAAVGESVDSENQAAVVANGACTSSGTDSADEFFDTLDESVSINSNRSEKNHHTDEVENKN